LNPIRLDDVSAIPTLLQAGLAKHTKLLRKVQSVESLFESGPIREIAEKLHRHVYSRPVLSYHCTKEPTSGFYRANGLRILDRREHQNEFLDRYGSLFTENELAQIREAWNGYFSRRQDRSRNGRIAFCFTPYLVINNGTEVFFRYFGGEAVFKPLTRYKSIMAKLESIGNPVVIVFSYRLDATEPFTHLSVANTLLSHYHRTLNTDALVLSKQGLRTTSVPNAEILASIPRAKFFEQYG
jgi:hypothetical protein